MAENSILFRAFNAVGRLRNWQIPDISAAIAAAFLPERKSVVPAIHQERRLHLPLSGDDGVVIPEPFRRSRIAELQGEYAGQPKPNTQQKQIIRRRAKVPEMSLYFQILNHPATKNWSRHRMMELEEWIGTPGIQMAFDLLKAEDAKEINQFKIWSKHEHFNRVARGLDPEVVPLVRNALFDYLMSHPKKDPYATITVGSVMNCIMKERGDPSLLPDDEKLAWDVLDGLYRNCPVATQIYRGLTADEPGGIEKYILIHANADLLRATLLHNDLIDLSEANIEDVRAFIDDLTPKPAEPEPENRTEPDNEVEGDGSCVTEPVPSQYLPAVSEFLEAAGPLEKVDPFEGRKIDEDAQPRLAFA